jgi:cysteine desulfurase
LIYLDNHATTRTDPEVVEAMLPFFSEIYGNCASVGHSYGRQALKYVNEAREKIAALIGAHCSEIVFTSGATESNNLALKGIAEKYAELGRHIITTAVEHKSVLSTCKWLETQGFEVTYAPVNQFGQLSPETLKSLIRTGAKGTKDRTVLVSVIAAQNEIGSINDMRTLATIAKDAGVGVHVDASQAVGKIPFKLSDLPVDVMSFTAHKMYGPKGVGAIYIRKSAECLKPCSQMLGGGQEDGMRSGTIPVQQVVGFGKCAEIAQQKLPTEMLRLKELRDQLAQGLFQRLGTEGIKLNGHPIERLPGNLHLSFEGIDGELLAVTMKGLAVSSGSACSSASAQPSYVLKAMGLSDPLAFASVRFGIGRFNTEDDINQAINIVATAIEKQREKNSLKSAAKAAHVATPR